VKNSLNNKIYSASFHYLCNRSYTIFSITQQFTVLIGWWLIVNPTCVHFIFLHSAFHQF